MSGQQVEPMNLEPHEVQGKAIKGAKEIKQILLLQEYLSDFSVISLTSCEIDPLLGELT